MVEEDKKQPDASGGEATLNDDASVASKNSTDAMLKTMLKDNNPIDDSMVIDIESKDSALDDLVEPLEDIEEEDASVAVVSVSQDNKAADSGPKWKTVFSPESDEEKSRLQMLSPKSSSDQTVVSLDENEISNLLKGELLEPPPLHVRPVTPHDHPASNFAAEANAVYRVMSVLRRLETPQVIARADEIVRECQFHHGQGDKRYENLPRSIFDRLNQLLGTPKFKEIYHRAMYVDPRSCLHSPGRAHHAHPPPGPSSIQLAIAYGIHIATTSNGSEPPLQQIQRGYSSLNSMNHKDRMMFWNFITTRKPSSKASS